MNSGYEQDNALRLMTEKMVHRLKDHFITAGENLL